ncbi:MAG: hypothetical protein H8E46_03255 [FCB group bacterium]|nr:hypothetical protein [FCB group bacterium]
MEQFLYQTIPLRKNFAFDMTDAEQEIIEEHFQYLKKLTSDSIVYLAGPVTDGSFGIVVFDAESKDFARAIMENDPAVKGGVMGAKLYPFRVSLFRGRD